MGPSPPWENASFHSKVVFSLFALLYFVAIWSSSLLLAQEYEIRLVGLWIAQWTAWTILPVLTEWQSPCILSLVSCCLCCSPCCSLVIVVGCQLCNEDFTVCCLGISLETCPAYVLRLISGYALRSCSSLFFFFKIRSASVQLFNAFLSSLFVTCLLQSHVQDAQMWSAEGRQWQG